MSALILLAPNPRVGYLLYPINFFVWAYLLAPSPKRASCSVPKTPRASSPERRATATA